MGIGSAAGGGGILRVDPEMLQQLGAQLETSARALPDPPERFPVTGADAISAAIAAKLPALETPIIEGLPAVKEAATQTAQNIQTAAARYLGTDADLAAEYEKHRFDQTGAPAGGGATGGPAGGGAAGAGGASAASAPAASAPAAGGGGAMGQMSQLMGMPMQMASQATQLPQQALGSLSSMPQTAMQGVQQISQLAGDGKGDGREGPGPDGAPPYGARPDSARPDDARPDDARQDAAAATGQPGGERAPVGEQGTGRHAAEPAAPATAVPDAGRAPAAPRHAKPDPTDL
ncbi:hypothetical protein [Mycolicibacterium grossiae]|uniref:PE domain-containing protein n=1 Tax=Mycolicibacterium grossiae TaxID=1552759 RepID=A0A1E8Q872_9MYCO|nr:hypothetical protein [Mycolicibacterium grossiae]OFJ54114.1 hypothetical protein BEL07_08660 [Mycolicibacterium grossiae]